jgi:hypothetical protein
MMSTFLRGHKLSRKSPARAWKPVTQGEIYVVLSLFMLIQKPTLRSYFITKGSFPRQDLEML